MADTPHFLPRDMPLGDVSERVLDIPAHFNRYRRAWWMLFGISCLLLGVFVAAAAVVLWNGVGVWGNNIPVNWGFAILNYMWWLGIGHAGTFISALLLLLNRPWRNSLNRLAELMTLMAVVCAGIYPILHLGRPWLFFWTAPYPNTMELWPQFKSPTAWDFFAVLGYLGVSLLFLYVGSIPDFASARDRATKRHYQVFYGLLTLGWRGASSHWGHWRRCYRFIALLAVPLVFSVSSGYSFLLDLAAETGWHSTVFPPYFVAGAVFSGFAMVIVIALGLRRFFGWQLLITNEHLNKLGLLLLASAWMTSYGYIVEPFIAFYSGKEHEILVTQNRMAGPMAWSFWLAIFFNLIVVQALWWPVVRRNGKAMLAIALGVLVGMWCERYMLIIQPPTRDFLVSSWQGYSPSLWDWALFVGTFGLFLVPFSLFMRFLPMISTFELKEVLHRYRGGADD
ncbi:NrfD/PsrC family molybdoenzyme membrane anchor subunit [Stutzerimonas nitrititolerans]|uniref:NrfD/PsrC family molybdoenzyme membrane anchor subunit n=1 Tax=Stutzerimonas nitrititolerans TaxID=2482751 RepID=UPI00289C7838|nr:NrfD/PsrC family molybdoenzyme membrane anchor subunit [Stutzerimonas nitrititolerans]